MRIRPLFAWYDLWVGFYWDRRKSALYVLPLPTLGVVFTFEKPEDEDICGLCGEPGADKIAHPNHWPGERVPDGELVHASCEDEECRRAHAALSDEQRRQFLGTL